MINSCMVLKFNTSDQILMVYTDKIRADGIRRAGWGLPGGKKYATEFPEVCARRECAEETGIELKDLTPFFIRQDKEGFSLTFLSVKRTDEAPVESPEGPVKYGTWQELFEGPFGDYNRRLFQEYQIYFSDLRPSDPVTEAETLCQLEWTPFNAGWAHGAEFGTIAGYCQWDDSDECHWHIHSSSSVWDCYLNGESSSLTQARIDCSKALVEAIKQGVVKL